MMYNQKLVASIKANGRVLREHKDTVYIKFGSEYSILLKNLHTQRALVNVYIDGDNIVPGGLVLNAGQTVDLERSVLNGNLTEGNKLKFIQMTNSIEKHRGVKLEDGLLMVEYQFEIPRPVLHIPDTSWKTYQPNPYNTPWYSTTATNTGVSGGTTDRFTVTASGSISQMNVGGILRGVDYSRGEATKASATAAINSVSPQAAEIHDGSATMDWCDAGITVPGSKSTQTFATASIGTLEIEKHQIILKLLGETEDNKAIREPVTVKKKPKCQTCGKLNKATAKYCQECGTALEIFA